MVGPVPVGVNSFTFSAPPPDPKRIPRDDVIGVAAIILTASYKDQEFVRVGYYQNTEYDDPKLMESIRENGMHAGDIKWDMLVRHLLADKPRVTRFTINWSVHLSIIVFLAHRMITYLRLVSQGHSRASTTDACSRSVPTSTSIKRLPLLTTTTAIQPLRPTESVRTCTTTWLFIPFTSTTTATREWAAGSGE